MRDPRSRYPLAPCLAALLVGALNVVLVPTASAQVVDEESPFRQGDDDESPAAASTTRADVSSPLRIVGGLGYTFAIRVLKHGSITPETLAPASMQLDLGVVLPGSGILRHGLFLSTVTNVVTFSDEERLDAFGQWSFAPSYLAYIRLSRDLLITGRFGIPLSITSPNTQNADSYFGWGLDLAGGAAYYLTAGFGLWGQLGASMFVGAEQKIYLLAAATVGVIFDWEVLS